MRRQFVALLISGIALCGSVRSPAQSKARLAFEVASVRAYMDSGFRNQVRITESRVDLIRAPWALLLDAFRHKNTYRLVVPEWVTEVGQYFEIHATMPPGATVQQVPEMLQTLLEDRFGLVTHRELRPMDGFELAVSEGGVRMREVEAVDELKAELSPDQSVARPPSDTVRETPDGPVRMIQVFPGGFRRITSRTNYERRTLPERRGAILTATRMTMAELVTELESNVDRPIVDRTGLTGLYQFTLQLPYNAVFIRMDAMASGLLGRPVGSAGAEPVAGVSVFKELERLGLKLEKGHVPVEMIVVDKISRTPTEN